MTREDIIELAKNAAEQAPREDWNTNAWVFGEEMLEHFAHLVAAAEREKVARWQIGSGYSTGHGDTIEDLLVELEWQVRESEREAIAQMIEDAPKLAEFAVNDYGGCLMCGFMPKLAATAIRARGEK